MMTKPTVSIIVPFYNGERFFVEALDSILGQTYAQWELILVDDGSTDGSRSIALAAEARHPDRITYTSHPGRVNRGLPASRNLGMGIARGSYLAFLDADDVWLPLKLERQVAVLATHQSAAMVYGPIVFWYSWTRNSDDAKRDFVCPMGGTYDVVIPPPAMLRRQIEVADGLPATCGVLVRRSIADSVGRFDESWGMYEDEVFFSKIALRYPVYVMRESLDLYRQHPDSMSARALQAGEWAMEPHVPNPARERYLRWLREYILDTRVDDGTLLPAIDRHLAAYR